MYDAAFNKLIDEYTISPLIFPRMYLMGGSGVIRAGLGNAM